MNPVGGSKFQAELPGLQPNDEVDYYIFAKDQSGRRECHPYVGAADPHHFSVDPVGINPTGIDDYHNNNVLVYPNPCTVQCFLRNDQADIVDIQVFDVCGKLILSESCHNNMVRLNTSSWIPGLYNVVVRDADGYLYHEKIVKR